MTLAEFARGTTYLSAAVDVGLLVQLLRYRLALRYRWLFCYFLADALQILLAIGVSRSSVAYGYLYFGGQAVKAALGAAIAVRLWKLALLAYPALARFGRKIAIYVLLAAMAIAAAGLLLEPATPRGQNPLVHSYQAIEAAVDSMVLLFLVAEVLFLLWFPVKVRRNVAVYMGGFVFYWFQHWALLLLVNLYPHNSATVSTVMLIFSLAILLLWVLTLRPEGETVTTVTGIPRNPAETEHLLGQLEAINTRLERMRQ
jgi:hypothetical protein